jgi:hypothetical protein
MSPVTFAPLASPDGAVTTLLGALGGVFGQDHVVWAGFGVTGARTPDWLLEHTLEGSRFDVGPLLLSRALADAVPALAVGVDPDRMACFEPLSPFGLCGELAQTLIHGGADLARRLPADAAYGAAREFVDAVLGPAIDRHLVLQSRAAWSAWFARDVWDRTWVIADPATDRVSLLCVTDVAPPFRPPPGPLGASQVPRLA